MPPQNYMFILLSASRIGGWLLLCFIQVECTSLGAQYISDLGLDGTQGM